MEQLVKEFEIGISGMEMMKLTPACKDYLWGGHRLVDEYGIKFDKEICAEAWTLSAHKDGESVVAGGEFAGKTLIGVIDALGKEILGSNCSRFEEFPILIKLIDAKKSLSIQVHPDNEYALKNEGQYGKTEMWYILEADEGAFLYEGFDHEISKEEFELRIRNNTLTDVLHKVYVKKGDVIFIEPGTLHAIGAGILIAEIQQSSNVTYRIYDYGRVGADGKPRELHIDKALDVTKLIPPTPYASKDDHLVSCEYFQVDSVELSGTGELTVDSASFANILCVSGSCTLSTSSQTMEIAKGESVFIPAGTGNVKLTGDVHLIITRIP